MLDLPKISLLYVRWFFLGFPKYLFDLARKIILLVDYATSFSLNLRLIFIPLFGDYTIVGRTFGFVFRLFEIVFGFVALGILTLLILPLPLYWYVLPILLVRELGFLGVVILVIFSVLRIVNISKNPISKVGQVSVNNMEDSYVLTGLKFLDSYQRNPKTALTKLLAQKNIILLLKRAELEKEDFINKLIEAPRVDIAEIKKAAFELAQKYKTRHVEIEHILFSLLSLMPSNKQLLSTYNSSLSVIEQSVDWIVKQRDLLSRQNFWQEEYPMLEMGGIGKGMTGHVTRELDAVSFDLTKSTRAGLSIEVVGRTMEIDNVARILGGSNVNVLLIGEPGSGKSSIVKGLASRIIEGTKYKSLRFKRIVSLETGSLIAGTSSTGELAEKIKRIMNEVVTSRDIILFVDDIHTLSGSSDASLSVVFNVLSPYLEGNQVQFIGATSMLNYRKYIQPSGSFGNLFEMVEIPPATKEDTLEILKVSALKLEKTNNIAITLPALIKCVDLSEKLIHERVFPDKAIDVLKRTAANISDQSNYLSVVDIEKTISEMTHVPVENVTKEESAKLVNIEASMKSRVIGQDQAVEEIARAIKRARAGIRDENKPIASFLFVGTTGVGKTETAKALAKEYFGTDDTMIRLDMSEYQHPDSINKLLGNPDGSSFGVLTEAVRSKPFSLLLLDEIEKSAPQILLTFLQVLDDGRLTDSVGRTYNFDNTIIIATSNVGTKRIQEMAGADAPALQIKENALVEVRNHFAPEFLNRFTSIVVFNPLTKENITKITDLMLNKVRKLASEKGIDISFSPELITELISRGYNVEWGARPMARVIEDYVESDLAMKILNNTVKSGDKLTLGKEIFNRT